MKKFLKIALLVVVCFIALSAGILFYLSRDLEAGEELEIEKIEFETVEDGIYRGDYKAGRFSNEIEVEVMDGEIVSLTVMDDVLFVREHVSPELFTRVKEEQSLAVDTVTEATVTSKAYLKAIENALSE